MIQQRSVEVSEKYYLHAANNTGFINLMEQPDQSLAMSIFLNRQRVLAS